jgi:glycosyltransferase involved in cell wall biosynthesis
MKKPLISIITACFNSDATIKSTIESVLNQSYDNIEYVLIDGNSQDKTLDIIKSYEQKFQNKGIIYKWISEPDNGIYNAFNKGLKLSKGEWISFVGSDDIYTNNAIELYVKNIPNNEVDLLYSNIKIIGKKPHNEVWSWEKFRRRMNIAHVGALHNRKYFKRYGDFNTSYRIAGDYELLLRAKENLKTFKLNELTVIMSDIGISNKLIKEVYKETKRAKKETAQIPRIICQLDYFIWMLKYRIKKMLYALV